MSDSKISLQLDKVKFSSKSLAITEPSVEIIATKLYENVLAGNASAIETIESLVFIGKVADVIKKSADENGKNNFTDLVRAEIQENLNGEKSITTSKGTKFSLAETGTKYDFTVCADPQWGYYNKEIDRLDKLKKKRETFLKTINEAYPAGNVLVSETGELHENVELFPPIKVSNSSFKMELAK